MTRAAALRRGRRAAEAQFVDTCRITRTTGARGPLDPTTGKYPDRTTEVIYEGRCKIQDARGSITETESAAGERDQTTQSPRLDLPVLTSGDVAVDDVAVLLTSPLDPSRVGRTYTVTGRHDKTYATARRLPVIEVTG